MTVAEDEPVSRQHLATVPPPYPGIQQAGCSWLKVTQNPRQRSFEYTPRASRNKTEVTSAAPLMFQIPQVVNVNTSQAELPAWDYITKPPKLKRDVNRDHSSVSFEAPQFFQIEDANEARRQRHERDSRRPGQKLGHTVNYHQKLICGRQVLLNPEPPMHTQPFEELNRAFARECRRTRAFRTAAFDTSHLPQTPPGRRNRMGVAR